MSQTRSRGLLPLLACGFLTAAFAVAAHAQDAKKQAHDLMTQGQQQMSKGQPRDAMRTFSKAMNLDPTLPRAVHAARAGA